MSLRDLHEIAAGIVEHGGRHRTHRDRRLSEPDAQPDQPVVLLANVLDGEGIAGDAIGEQGSFERLCGRMLIRLQQQPDAVLVFRGGEREPAVRANGMSSLSLKPSTSR